MTEPTFTDTQLLAHIADILWPDADYGYEWGGDELEAIAAVFHEHRPDWVPPDPEDDEGGAADNPFENAPYSSPRDQ